MHFQPGVAEYPEFSGENGKPLRIYVSGDTAKQMDPSFRGKPVFVKHKSDITEEEFQNADGYVWNSFFNKSDGNHWVQFIVTTPKGKDAISKGWKLSNAYYRESESGPGSWHSVPYDSEVKSGKYDHLAIVDTPRYEESNILTTEEFQIYNQEKERELLRLANSKPKKRKGKSEGLMFNMFKKTKLENEESENLKDTVVTLPKSGKELSIEEIIQNADKYLVNEEEKDKENKKKNKKNEDMKEPKEEGMENEDKDEDKKSMNEGELAEVVKRVHKLVMDSMDEKKMDNEDDEDKKSENEYDEDDKEKKNTKNSVDPNYILALQNAMASVGKQNIQNEKVESTVDLRSDQLARGKERY